VNRTIVRLGLRSVFGRRRGILLFVLPVVLIGLGLLVRLLAGATGDNAETVLDELGLTIVVPLVALIATTGLLAPEIDDGSISYLLAKPVSRHTIVLSKLVVAVGCVLVFAALPMLVTGLLIAPDEPRLALGYAIGTLAGGTAYAALFALLSVLTKHAVVVGLIYLLVWETLVGSLLDGVRWFSIARWSSVVVEEVTSVDVAQRLGPAYAVSALAVVILGATYLTGRRLRSFNLTGED